MKTPTKRFHSQSNQLWLGMICWFSLALYSPALAQSHARPFSVGEQLDFSIYFEFILGGHATMSIKEIESVGDRPCYHFVSEARSTRTVDTFYKVRDRIESWRDVEGKYSIRYVKRVREGRYRSNKRVDYFPDIGRAHLYRNDAKTPDTLKVRGYVQDVLSAFYAMREVKLEVGKSVMIDVHDIDKQYELEVKVLGMESVRVPAGKFDCFVIEPKLQSAGIFRKEGDLRIWLTDDAYRMPVLMKSKLYFGRVWAKLIKFKRGVDD